MSNFIRVQCMLFAIFYFSNVLSQVGDFSDMESALKNPNDVLSLTLREQGYHRIPKEIIQFKNLKYLDLSMNPLRCIPKWLSELKSLKELVITHSSLRNIDNLPYCEGLERVSLNFCEVSFIPENIHLMTNLERLNLFENEVKDVPLDICQLLQLKELVVYNLNPKKQLSMDCQRRLRECFNKEGFRLVICAEDKR